MKQVININFHGQVIPIEVSAFDLLKSYTDSLSRHFANEEGKDEIINDIESRIAELFQERIKKGATCITDDDVNAIINSIGRPEDFDIEDEKPNTSAGQQQSTGNSNANFSFTGPKRLYRSENEKVVGGVCSGIARYFGIDPIVVRIIFVVVSLAFGTGVLAYLIMWVAVPSSAAIEIGGVRKKLFRDPDDKLLAGVGSGLGNYFGINPWIPRTLFLLPFISFAFSSHRFGFMEITDILNFSFSPGSLIAYIIFWLVIPEANTTAEKLEMKGEKVDMNSIKNSVVEELKGVQKRAEKFGQEASTIANEKGQQLGAELKTVAKRSSKSIGDIIALIVKGFAYFIIGTVCFGLVVALFALAIASISVFPLKAYVLTDGWQNSLAWGTLIFFIAAPIVGLITWIIRRLAKIKSNGKILRFSFISLWIVGWACVISLIASLSKDFRSASTINIQEIPLSNPTVQKLEVTTLQAGNIKYRNNYFRIQPFESWAEDTVLVQNISVKIIKSPNDSFRVTMAKLACGQRRVYADSLASMIQFNVKQQDSLLILDKGININQKDKFRNQRVVITIYVPVGKQIKVDNNIGWGGHINFGDNDMMDVDLDNEEDGWERGVDYIMKADGLYTLGGEPANQWKREQKHKVHVGPDGIEVNDGNQKVNINANGISVDSEDNYRYDNKVDSVKLKVQQGEQRVKDSLRKVRENIDRELEKFESNGTASSSGNYPLMLISPVNSLF